MPPPPFITFEGCEGCGKSTQVRRLAGRLEKAGLPFLLTREPGGTRLGEAIRDLLLFTPEGAAISAEAELLLFEASRSQLVREVINPAREAGSWVISDRFFDSTTVYQGAARQLDAESVRIMNEFAVGACLPDVTFILDLEVEKARQRLLRRVRPAGPLDRLEEEPVQFHEEVRRGYHALAAREPSRVVLIDASQTADLVEEEIWKTLQKSFRASIPVAGQ